MEALESETPGQAQARAPVSPASPRREVWKAIGAVVRLVAVLVVMLAVYLVAPWDRRLDLPAGALLLGWLVVLALVVVLDVLAVLRSRYPWRRAAEGAVLSVLVLLLPFAAAYVLLEQADPANFTQPLTRIDGLYFAVTVFSTVGFGDIAPASEVARVLVTIQILVDLLLVGIIVKVLVGAAQMRRQDLGRSTGDEHSDGAGGQDGP
jgi:voltage-gated potassium channel